MKALGWTALIAFLLLSGLNFNTSQNLSLWMLSIAVTEYGHYFAILGLIFMLFFYRRPKVMVILAVAVCVYSIPTVQLIRMFPRWENELTGTFGMETRDSVTRLPDWTRLLFSPSTHPHPETITYDDSSEKLKLDFFRASQAHAPFLLVIHGGGWNSGDRTQFADMNQYFADQGYAVVSVDYRLAPKFTWPAPKEDVLKALKYVRAHADEMGIDPNRWVIWGRSAGGQIAESVAYSSPAPEGLKGCIAFYSPADMNYAYLFSQEDDILKSPSLMRGYLGGDPKQVRAAYDDASPILAVNGFTVPTLLMHGPRDPLVWVKQSERLFAKLQMARVSSMYIRVPWATHGFDFHLNGPGGQIATFAAGRFLGKVLE